MVISDLKLPLEPEGLSSILKKYGVVRASVFGSYARGEAGVDSDLDILVSYGSGVSLFDHYDLKDELERSGGKRVDVVSEKAISKHLKPYIYKDKITVLYN
jgi:predicted nucleotidyltransferase